MVRHLASSEDCVGERHAGRGDRSFDHHVVVVRARDPLAQRAMGAIVRKSPSPTVALPPFTDSRCSDYLRRRAFLECGSARAITFKRICAMKDLVVIIDRVES